MPEPWDSPSGMGQAIRELAAEERRAVKDHPTPDELLDYHAGDLNADERERIQDHLALCPACVRAVLDLDAFPHVEALRPEEGLADDEITAEWEHFRERTGKVRLLGGVRRFGPAAIPWAVAAGLVLAVLGLSLRLNRLQQRVGELAAPHSSVQLVDLFPAGGGVERSERGAGAVQPAPWAERFVLILNLADVGSFPEYAAEITAADGREIWRGGGLRRSPEGTFALEVPRRLLPAGAYRIRLFGSALSGPTPVAEYALRLED